MPDYRALYFALFGAMADAVEALERREYETAREILIQAELAGERAHLETDGQP